LVVAACPFEPATLTGLDLEFLGPFKTIFSSPPKALLGAFK